MTTLRIHVLFWLMVLTLALPDYAQDSWVSLRGSVGASSDYFSNSSPSFPAIEPIHRASLNLTLNLFDQVQLPFNAYITNRGGAGYSQPFSQFGISPRFGSWLQLHAGYFNKQHSELTLGDVRLLGGGADVTLGNLQVSAVYGYSLLARSADSAQNYAGTYARRIIAGQFGYTKEGTKAHLSIMHAEDDEASITRSSATPAPHRNLVGSFSFSSNLIDKLLQLNAEGGISMFTANQRAVLMDSANRIGLLESMVGYNSSTSVDASFRVGTTVTVTDEFSLQGNLRWVGPGFISLGYIQMLNDMFDMTVSPSLRLFESRVNISGSIGTRSNNVRNTKENTITQLIGSANVSVAVMNNVNINASYSNFGMRSSVLNDTLRLSNLSQFLSLSPVVNFAALGGMNAVTASVMYQVSEDRNQFTAASVNAENTTYSAMHSINFPSTLSLTTMLMHNNARNGAIPQPISVTNINETVGYSIFNNTLALNASAGVNLISTVTKTTQFFARLQASYSAGSYGNFTVMLLHNNYSYTAAGALATNDMQGSMQYGISF